MEHKIDVGQMTNEEVFELLFGLKLPYLKMCTREVCPEPCPFCYECKTWLEKKFDPKHIRGYILSKIIEYAIEDLEAEGIIQKFEKFELKEDTDLVFESDIVDEFNKIGCRSFFMNDEMRNAIIKLEEGGENNND